jgi:hypothetical protein
MQGPFEKEHAKPDSPSPDLLHRRPRVGLLQRGWRLHKVPLRLRLLRRAPVVRNRRVVRLLLRLRLGLRQDIICMPWLRLRELRVLGWWLAVLLRLTVLRSLRMAPLRRLLRRRGCHRYVRLRLRLLLRC